MHQNLDKQYRHVSLIDKGTLVMSHPISQDNSDPPLTSVELPSKELVRAYLTENQNFFIENPDILAQISLPVREFGDGVLDFQRTINNRLQQDLKNLRAMQEVIIENSKENFNLNERFHATVLTLIDANSMGDLVEKVATTLPNILSLNAAGLLIEADNIPTSWLNHGFHPIARGRTLALMESKEIILRAHIEYDSTEIYGAKAADIFSDALIRIPLPDDFPNVLFAMGVNQSNHFHMEHRTEYIAFLASIIARCIIRWA